MKNARIVCALCALTGAAAPVSASVFFTFADPPDGLEVRYEQPAASMFGTMTYGVGFQPPPLLDFIVDASQEGGSIHHIQANLVWTNWFVGALTTVGPISSAMVSGDFDFIDASGGATDGQSILSGTFSTGLVIQALGTGSIVTSTDSGLDYTIGPALSALEPQITSVSAFEDGTYTLTDITFDGAMEVNVNGGDFFGSFSANAAFTGTAEAEIPTPGSIGLAMLGAAGLIRRRRR